MAKEVTLKEKKSGFANFFDTVSEGTMRKGTFSQSDSIMKKKESKKVFERVLFTVLGAIVDFMQKNLFVLLAFAVPFVLMSIAFAIMKCEPFGDKQILVTDLWHQYYPFLVDYQDKLKNGESLFWSWTQGGGTNYMALASYYLASPLNFLTVFIPSEWLRMFLTFSVSLKIGLAGGFFAMFLRYAYKRDDITLSIFGTCFGLSAFFMGYYWCDIWLDTVALTPLVVMGFLALMREGKYRMYVIALALSILANYYIGLFTCIFIFLCFIGYQLCCWTKFTTFLKNFGRIALFTVIAVMLTLFLMLPAFFGLQNTHAAGSTFPVGYSINIGDTSQFYEIGQSVNKVIPFITGDFVSKFLGTLDAFRQVIGNTMAFVEPTTTEGLPNVACGVITIVLAILFMTSGKIKLREKLFDGALLIFLILSFIIRPLDYMWHGFHFTNMIPYRFSYLVSFILVAMAFRALSLIDFSNYIDLIITTLATAVIIIMGIGVHEENLVPIIATSILAAVTIGLLFMWRSGAIVKPMLCLLLVVITLGQGAVTAHMGVETTSVTSTYDYPRGEENTEDVIRYMKVRENETPELYRADFTSTQTLCDPSLNKINGISMFNSMTNESFTKFAQNFGLMGWLSGNRYTYAESSPITNLFMNMKYVIARDGNFNNTQYLNEVYSSGSVKLTENESYIPMGFMTNSELVDFNGTDAEDTYNPFEKQNEFFRLATGIEEDVYTRLEVVTQGHTDYETFPVNKIDYGYYNFSTNDESTAPHLKWNYEAPEDGFYYAYVQISDEDYVSIRSNDVNRTGTNSFYIKRPYIMAIGYFNKGDKISVYSDLEADASGSAKVYVNYFDEKIYEKGVKKLKESVMKTTSYSGSTMDGEIDVKEDGLFYTSIPFEDGRTEDDSIIGKLFGLKSEGWTAYVDGKEVEITPIADALVAFPLEKGKHTIHMRYVPKGFTIGATISCVGLLLFAGIIFLSYKRKKKLAVKAEVADAENKK